MECRCHGTPALWNDSHEVSFPRRRESICSAIVLIMRLINTAGPVKAPHIFVEMTVRSAPTLRVYDALTLF